MLVITVWSVGPWNLSFAVGSANHNPVQFLVYALPSILGVWFRTHQLLAVNPCKIKILELLVYNFWFLVMVSFISCSSVVGMLIYTWFDLNSDWGSQFIPCGSVSVLSVLGSLQWVVCSLLVTPIKFVGSLVVVEEQIFILTSLLWIVFVWNMHTYATLWYRPTCWPSTDLLHFVYPFCSSWTNHAASWTHLL